MKRTIRDIDVDNKKVFLRVDFNVPIGADFKILDDNRIVQSLPTINYLIDHNSKLILCSHLGRPNGVDSKLSLRPVVSRLSKLLNKPVTLIEDIYDKKVSSTLSKMKPGDIVMLENIRFYKQEEDNDEEFSKHLASFADVYINDAFATMHRKHASTFGVAELLPNAVGFLVEKELKAFDKVLQNDKHPFVLILGGAKVTDKIKIIKNLFDKVDIILIGGGMAYTFIKAIGGEVGESLLDNSSIDLAKDIMETAKAKNIKIMLPVDNIGAKEFSKTAKAKHFNSGFFSKDYQGMDIGPHTIKAFKKIIKKARVIVWNGPMGVYEFPKFRKGTNKIAEYVSKNKGYTIVGGGDSAACLKPAMFKRISHVSTGGGASLELLQGKVLPCVDVISEI